MYIEIAVIKGKLLQPIHGETVDKVEKILIKKYGDEEQNNKIHFNVFYDYIKIYRVNNFGIKYIKRVI